MHGRHPVRARCLTCREAALESSKPVAIVKKTARPQLAVQSSASLCIDETCRLFYTTVNLVHDMRLAVLGSLAAVAATVAASDSYEHEDDFNNEDYIPE